MDPTVRSQLVRLSASFYAAHAESFDESRQGSWDSWQQLLTQVQAQITPTNILDLGCGNGRFAAFLIEHLTTPFTYTGIDSEASFISKAKERHPTLSFQVATLSEALNTEPRFDLIACFGVFHHLPGADLRNEILQKIADALLPGGVAIVSLWQPTLLKNFASKVASNHNIEGLEYNDFLLGWKGDFSELRYCHNFDDDEINLLIGESSLELITQFQGSGNDSSNRYVLLQNER